MFVCRLYRALDDYDVVRGIFSGKVGTKSITCNALQAEANTDFAEAVKLYNEVQEPSAAARLWALSCRVSNTLKLDPDVKVVTVFGPGRR